MRVANTNSFVKSQRLSHVWAASIGLSLLAAKSTSKETSAEIAFAIFIAKNNLPMAVGDEFGLLAKKMWCTTVPDAPPGGGYVLTTAFHAFSSGLSRFFVR